MGGLLDHREEKLPVIGKCAITCPTCQGKGKLTQSQADNLVAIIPAGDKRLKPRRTKLYLAITGVLSTLVISLIAFFLWRRPVSVRIIAVETEKVYMPFFETPWIDFRVTYLLTNKNFFQAEITDIKTRAKWNKFTMFMDTGAIKPIKVKALSSSNHSYIIRQKFGGKLAADKARYSCLPCILGWVWKIFEEFTCSATISMLLTSEQVTDTYYSYVVCCDKGV